LTRRPILAYVRSSRPQVLTAAAEQLAQ
jgi:hypothetical protein